MPVCLNCGESFTGEYCPRCGQVASVQRITVKRAMRSFWTSVTSMDGSFFRTMSNLLWRPGHLVHDYLCGKRARYVHPVKLLTSLVAIYLFVIFIFGMEAGRVVIFDDAALEEHVHSDSLAALFGTLSLLLSNKVVSSLFLAFVGVFPFSLLFLDRKVTLADGLQHKLNLAEYFCALVYVSCICFTVSMVLKLFGRFGLESRTVYLLDNFCLLFFHALTFKQLFGISWLRSAWRSLLAMLLAVLSIVLVVIITFGLFYGMDAIMD